MNLRTRGGPQQPGGSRTDARRFYEEEYFKEAEIGKGPLLHYDFLCKRLGVGARDRVLDVACGTGNWLFATSRKTDGITGVDISETALKVCSQLMPEGSFVKANAVSLPFEDTSFNLVTCLGALEHFPDISAALQEISRVGEQGARFLFCIPNANFLARRLGLFQGTEQEAVREVVLNLPRWENLFEQAGFVVKTRWRDLHFFNVEWLFRHGWLRFPVRLAKAVATGVMPVKWQYQVYYLCRKR